MLRLAIVAAALVALAVAAWPDARPPAPVAATAAPPVAPAASPARISPPPPRPLDEAAGFDEAERAQAAVLAHGRRCWETRVPRATPPGQVDETVQSVRLRLRVTVAAGEGRTELVEAVDDRVVDAGLRACLLDVGGLSWASPGPAGTVELTQLVRVADFTVPLGPPPASAPRPGVVPPEQRVPAPPG